MAKGAHQKLKLLYLAKILWEQTDEEHPMTIAAIIEALSRQGVSAERKSLYDDFEALRHFGLDIVGRKDKTYGYYLASREFELAELKLLVDAVQSSRFITRKKSNELIRKLEGMTSSFEGSSLQRQVYVANRVKTMNESIYYNVDRIHSAIGENTQIGFYYFDLTPRKEKSYRHEGEEYQVSPWALAWQDEHYYLIGYDPKSEQIRHYRVDKMERLRTLSEKREGEELFHSFDLGEYSSKMFGMFGGEEELVRLRCRNDLAGAVMDRFGKEITLFPCEDYFEVTIKAAVSPWFLSWIFGFGGGITIVSPESVRDYYRTELKKATESL
ncbi:MAG: WYL domain-containing protein [Ruminococcaceae bacterium]|nr:WYL domain-containing protein [Oscillospiraceae bacterium]